MFTQRRTMAWISVLMFIAVTVSLAIAGEDDVSKEPKSIHLMRSVRGMGSGDGKHWRGITRNGNGNINDLTALVKAKEYNWKDSNLKFFGTDVERNIKKDSAKTEPAWKNAGLKPGLQIWRIVTFKVMEWPLKDYGKFFNGDSYIVLHTYKEPGNEQLLYDVHFWIGKYSTQDEYGTAAYKTVELDTHLDDVPIQHREVQGHESDLFCSYFPIITIMEGGAESGFKKVKPEAYKPRLLHFHGDSRGVRVTEVPRSTPVDSGDVYILDLGLRLIQWNGKGSNKEERFRALRYIKGIVNERRGKPQKEIVDEGSGDGDFNSYLTEQMETEEQFLAADRTKKLFRLSDASGELLFTLEKKGDVSIDYFDSKDVFILDTKSQVFVWTGNQTSPAERRNAVSYAHKYLMKTDHPQVPVESLSENGRKSPAFQNSTRCLTYQQYVCKARDTRRK